MEKWKEVFVGKIPQAVYHIEVVNGEEGGLVIKLRSIDKEVKIEFGVVRAVRMLDEGIVQEGVYSEKELERFKRDGFSNVIYEVKQGEFADRIYEMSGGYGDVLDLKHYVIITLNFNIDIVTEWEPEIKICSVDSN